MKRSFIVNILIVLMILCLTSCTNNIKGDKVRIGVIDTSISNDTIKEYKIKNITDFVYEEIEDNYTHGAILLNIIAENVKDYDFYYASALDCTQTGKIEDVISAIDWCIQNNVDIICMSFATLSTDSTLQEKIAKAQEAGIIIVASCINYSDLVCYPAMSEGVISVSEGTNTNATIIIEDKIFEIDIDGEIVEWNGCSALTAYVCGRIANELSNGKEDVFEIIESIKEN